MHSCCCATIPVFHLHSQGALHLSGKITQRTNNGEKYSKVFHIYLTLEQINQYFSAYKKQDIILSYLEDVQRIYLEKGKATPSGILAWRIP